MNIFKSIQSRTLATIVPVLVVILGLTGVITFLDNKNTLEEQIDYRMDGILESVTQSVENNLQAHSKIPELMASQIETSPYHTVEQYEKMFRKVVPSNEATFGAGVYFEPYKYNATQEFFSLYVYREGDKLEATEVYSDPAYNYPTQDWYTMVADTDKKVVFSNPYYDETSDVTMVTTSSPFYNGQNKLLGVTTADINLTQIQTEISEIKIEESGYAFLIDTEGTYIATPQSDKVMQIKVMDDPNASLASLGNQIVTNTSGSVDFKENKDEQILYFKKIPSTNWTLGLVVPYKELYASLSSLMVKQFLISFIGIVLIISVVLIFSKWIIRNIGKVNALAQSVAHGDLRQRVDIKSQDEFGQMADRMNQMQENLREMINNISVASETINGHSEELTQSANEVKVGSEQITITMEELAKGSEKQADNASNLVMIMDTFTAEVEETNTSGEQIKEASHEVLRLTNNGKGLMESSNEQMLTIYNIVKEAVRKMDKLDNETQEISKLVAVIKDIADQTNLLALNAAIEAARAGEHGKGFSVVAGEVKKLAEQVATSIEDITGFVTNIQSESKGVTESLQVGYTEVEKGTSQIKTTVETFNEISTSVSSMVDNIQSMSNNLEKIATECREMNVSIEEIASISQESAAGVEQTSAATQQVNSSMDEVASSSEELANLAEKLNQIVREFKI